MASAISALHRTLGALLLTTVAASYADAAAHAQQQISRAAVIESFRARIASDVEADATGGITAAVVVGNEIVWAEGFGWADVEKRRPAGVDTIYRAASVTKTVTAVALMHLVQRRIVRLDDAVATHLPEASEFVALTAADPPVLLRQLASHTAGLAREPWLPAAGRGPVAQWESDVIAAIRGTAFPYARGEAYNYSNVGYAVLGLALSRAAHEPFMQMIEERIFRPLGMNDSAFVVDPLLAPRVSKGYENFSGIETVTQHPLGGNAHRGYRVPSSGMYSTVGDLARLIALLTGAAGDAVLDAGSREQMLSFHAPFTGRRGYGLGLRLRTGADGRVLAGHDGRGPGYAAQIAFDPHSRIGVILLRNYNVGRTDLSSAAYALVTALARAAAE